METITHPVLDNNGDIKLETTFYEDGECVATLYSFMVYRIFNKTTKSYYSQPYKNKLWTINKMHQLQVKYKSYYKYEFEIHEFEAVPSRVLEINI